jgi:hypothetical protein
VSLFILEGISKGYYKSGELKSQRKIVVKIKDKPFLMDIAKTSEERNLGLMYKESLDSNKGMIFIYNKEKKYSFWMKNTMIPLDIIWLNKSKNVVYISKNTQPCKQNDCPSIKPNRRAIYVLEINANLSDKLGLNIGDLIEFDII